MYTKLLFKTFYFMTLIYIKIHPYYRYTRNKMAELIIPLNEFDINKVEFSKIMTNKKGGKMCYMNYNNEGRKVPFMLRSPKFSLPFGCNDKPYKDNPTIKYSFSTTLAKDDSAQEGLVTFTKILKDLDKLVLDEGVKNAKTWFPDQKKPSKEVIEAFFKPCVRYPNDETKLDTYPPTFNVKLPVYDQRRDPSNPNSETFKKAGFKLFDHNKDEIDFVDGNIVDLSMLGKGSTVMCLLKCTGLHFTLGKFGLSWKVEQIKVNKPKGIIGCAIIDTDDEEEEGEEVEGEEEEDC